MTKEELESGLKKFEIISPLLSEGLEPAQKRRLRKEILEKHGIAERTLRSYLQKYREKGYDGLLKQRRHDKGTSKSVPDDVLAKAIELRRELPGRSVRRVITILESEGIISPGQIPKSTLSRQMLQNGCGAAESKATVKPAGKRFQKEGRNVLWQADVKYGSYITGKNGKKVQTYILVIIDDATRMIMHSEIYDNQKLPILEDCFRKALQKFGIPDAVYVDNGKIFVSKWFRLACARLGIRHIATQIYSPSSKGKVERFNGFLNEFLEELSLEPENKELNKPSPIIVLNQKFRIWLEEGYTHKPHSALGGKTPFEAYRENPKKVRFASSEDCHNLFLWEETRKVDKTGVVKLNGTLYEAGADLCCKKVDIRFDPFDPSIVEIWHGGLFVRKSAPLVIPEFIPKTIQANPPGPEMPAHSRLFAAYDKSYKIRDRQKNGAISFVDIQKEDVSHV